jgi:hypothetical protein
MNLIVLLIVLQIFVSIVAVPLAYVIRSYARVRLVDRSHGLISEGIVDRAALKSFYPELGPYNLAEMSHFFMGDALDLIVRCGILTVIISVFTATVLIYLLFQFHKCYGPDWDRA